MISVRKVTQTDLPFVVGFIEKLAEFNRELGCFDGTISTTRERISRALFGVPTFAHAFLAISDGKPVGFAFYHYRFSSFQARPSLWLEDLYVDTEARRGGAGLALMSALAAEASAHDCTHIAWTADVKNPLGLPFYTKMGATLVSQHDPRLLTYSVTPDLLSRTSQETKKPNKSVQPTLGSVTPRAIE